MASHSAVTNWYAETGIGQTQVYPDLLDKSFDLVQMRWSKTPIQGARFYSEHSADTLVFKLTTVGAELDLPVKREDTDPLPFVIPAPGYDISFSLYTYANAVRVTKTMVETDQHGKIGAMFNGLFESAKLKLEYLYAGPFNSAFATTLGADGMYMCDTGHPFEDPAAGTWDNLETAASFTRGTTATMKLKMRKRKNSKGFISPIVLTDMVIPSDLEEEAWQVNVAPQEPENVLHAPNFMKGKYTPIVWDWLTSTTAYFGIGDMPKEQWGLHYMVGVKPEIGNLTFENPTIVMGRFIRFRVATGFSIAKNVHGNVGA